MRCATVACALAAVAGLIGCGGDGSGGPDAAATPDGAAGPDADPLTADALLAAIANCDTPVGGDFATDEGLSETIAICGLPGAVFWKADLDIDCDGQMSAVCNSSTDPAYQSQTSATDSQGEFLDAATLPYVVVPLPSARFDYGDAGLELGTVIAVIYDGRVEYGVFGDEGPPSIIGEASYRMAELLAIDPDPSTGGADSGAAYIAFTGPDAVVAPIEDHAAAIALGETLARALLAQ